MCKQYTIFNKKTHFANFKGKILYEILGNPGQTSLWIQQLWADPPLTPFAEQDQTSSRMISVGRTLKVDPEPLLPFFLLVLVVVEFVKLARTVGNIRLQFPRIFQ